MSFFLQKHFPTKQTFFCAPTSPQGCSVRCALTTAVSAGQLQITSRIVNSINQVGVFVDGLLVPSSKPTPYNSFATRWFSHIRRYSLSAVANNLSKYFIKIYRNILFAEAFSLIVPFPVTQFAYI